MGVVGIGENEAPALGIGHLRARKPRLQNRDLAPRHQLLPRPEPRRRARPFLEHARAPERHEEPGPGHAQQHLAQHRRIKHAGIEENAHQESRKNRALR